MEVISTSAHNILIAKHLPAVSVHYYEQTQQIVTDARHERENFAVTASARTDAKAVSEKEKQKRNNQQGYEVGLSKQF
jgi:hypothetical protein